MRLALRVVLVVALLVASAATAPAAAQSSSTARGATMSVQIQADRAAFEDLRTAFANGEADVSFPLDAFRRAAAAASNATGRKMRVTGVSRTSDVVTANGTGTPTPTATGNRSVGILRLSFTWTAFATTAGDRVVVGDAFNTTSGTWLPVLTANQTLVVRPPADYAVDSAPLDTNPDSLRNGVLTWTGPRTFAPGDLSITYVRSNDPDRGGPFADVRLPENVVPLAISGVGIGAIILGVVLRNRYRDADGEAPAADAGDGGPATDASAEAATDADQGDDGGAVDPELLSDEERVVHLLERNGGRMKQASIVTETGWSNAKVSQLLSAMAEDGEVEKLRIGRENLISLPDADPEDDGER